MRKGKNGIKRLAEASEPRPNTVQHQRGYACRFTLLFLDLVDGRVLILVRSLPRLGRRYLAHPKTVV